MEDITAVTGITDVGRLNDNLQTLTVTVPPTGLPNFSTSGIPRLVQLNFTPTAADAPPVAAFTWSCERKKCTFDASGSTDDNGIVSYEWDLDRDHGNDRKRGVVVKTTYAQGRRARRRADGDRHEGTDDERDAHGDAVGVALDG